MWDAIIITPFVNVLLLIYHYVFSNFGIAIILFTILIRLITYPLFAQQMKGAQAMQGMQNDERYKEMQKKYKDDKEKLAQEQMKLYREMGINPLGSCLPTLIQFPIIIGLYQSITRALATTPFDLLILERQIYPGLLKASSLLPLNNQFLWMDLSQPEKVIIPFLNNFGLPVLAIIVVITTYMQSKVMTPVTTNPNDQSAGMMKAMNLYMPFLMGWLALTLSSGLAIYFVASNVIGIVQYMLMGKANWRALIPSFKLSPTNPPKAPARTEKTSYERPKMPAPRTEISPTSDLGRNTPLKPSGSKLPPIKPSRKANGKTSRVK
jgi:YidC/Oxa1 family membrane protein insertase